MKSSTKSRQDEYISRLKKLYAAVETWTKDTDLGVLQGTIELDEEVPGRYEAPTLTIQDSQGKQLAALEPVGAWIIGAEGRVDMSGPLNRESLVYMAKGGPQFTAKATDADKSVEEHTTPLFRGVNEAGWYWIERWRPSRAHRVDEELFMDLLSEVSDYDVR